MPLPCSVMHYFCSDDPTKMEGVLAGNAITDPDSSTILLARQSARDETNPEEMCNPWGNGCD
jgi:hypothetical protein